MLPLLLALSTAAPPEVPIAPDLQMPMPKPPTMPPGPPPQRTWNRMFPPAEMCAPPAVQPFYKQPRVCPVAVCECDGGGAAVAKWGSTWVKEFSGAASVPIPRFDQNGSPVCGDGLIIYEGMRLTVDPETGLYDLTFTASVPNTSAVLRMQLTFTDSEKLYTLTLPPIPMHPPRDAKPGDPVGTTFHIAHRGYSTLFLAQTPSRPTTEEPNCRPLAKIDCTWQVKRDGTARFGTPVAILAPNR